MLKNKMYITQDFKTEILCYFKDTNGGVYDVYVKGCCIAVGITKKSLKELTIILKLKTNDKSSIQH